MSTIPLLAVPPIVDGEPVSAATDNQRINALRINQDRLAAAILALKAGRQVLLFNQTAAEACDARGIPVVWDDDTARFRPTDITDFVNSRLYVWGTVEVVYPTITATMDGNVRQFDILLTGVQDLSGDELLGLTGTATPAEGAMFVSSVTGQITPTPPEVFRPVPVGTYKANMLAVNTQVTGIGSYSRRYQLVCEPAGVHVPPSDPNPHVVTSPNTGLPGWLPINQFVVDYPVGAVFGYNRNEDPDLLELLEGFEASTAWFELDRGDGIGSGLPTELIQLTETGIWWMSDCYGQVPWPLEMTTDGVARPTVTPSVGCPVIPAYRLTLWVDRPAAEREFGVRSITSGDGTIVTDEDDVEADTGNLIVALRADPDEERSAVALRSFGPDGVASGPVVEAIRVAGPGVIMSGGTNVPVDPEDPGGPQAKSGTVTVTILPPSLAQLMPGRIWMNGTGEDTDGSAYFITMTNARPTALIMRFDVPITESEDPINVKVVLQVRGSIAGTCPPLAVSVRRVPRPVVGAASEAPTVLDDAVGNTTTGSFTGVGYIRSVETPEFEIASNETVFVILEREGPGDGYGGVLGLMSQYLTFVS